MPPSRLEYLFDRFLEGSCSLEEEKEFMQFVIDCKNENEIKSLFEDVLKNTSSVTKVDERSATTILKSIIENSEGAKISRNIRLSFSNVAAAAVVLLFISGLAYWFIPERKSSVDFRRSSSSEAQVSKIVPGGKRAILTMGDGSTIVLDSLHNASIQRGSVKISKKDGLLIYDGSARLKKRAPEVFNTLTTPRGGQYKVILADGTKVWLNASSSLRFPTAFTGRERTVELTGEGYFEVARNKKKPFHVNVNEMQVEVLGTHFNINAYDDECSIKTSLLEGSVKIKKGDISSFLKPGQEGVLKKNSDNVKIKNIDVNQVVAWKNGLFEFDGADIKSIMRQIGRWYDVDVAYSGKIPKRRFEGTISRDAQLSDVLEILKLSNVKFSVQGKKIVIL